MTVLAEVAFAYHFPRSELWEMEVEELMMWHAEWLKISERLKS